MEYKRIEPCYCEADSSKYRESCKFYHEVQDMNACIPCCSLTEGLGNCPCSNCSKYESKYEKEKTGKEMLEELGYEERNSRLFVSWAYDSPKSYSFEIQTNGDVKYITQDAFCGASYVMLPPEEIHAMHHLLEERGL